MQALYYEVIPGSTLCKLSSAVCLMIVHDMKMITFKNNHDPLERQINWVIKKVCNWVIGLGWNKNWTDTTEVKRANTSWKELRWEERDERNVAEWCQNPRNEQRSSGKMIEVCCSSYRQNLFVDPIAVHFSKLETSATWLARALLVDLS